LLKIANFSFVFFSFDNDAQFQIKFYFSNLLKALKIIDFFFVFILNNGGPYQPNNELFPFFLTLGDFFNVLSIT
jgi:hypothetical protein